MIDPIITFLNKVAYKFPKGYPDMNDPKDKKMLFEMITGIVDESKADDKKTAIQILKDTFKLDDESFKDKGLNFHLLVPRQERQQYIDDIEKLEGFEYNPQPSGFSSIGYLTYNDVKIAIKPSGIQGTKSAGLENEDIFVKNINKYLEDGPKNIILTDGSRSIEFPDVDIVKGSGTATGNYSKSDANFYSNDKDLGGVSLKKNNAIYWESADTRFKDEVNNLLDAILNGKLGNEISFKPLIDKRGNEDPVIIRMWNKVTDEKIPGIIVKDLPPIDTYQSIFGNDQVPVVMGTWKESDFSVQGDDIIVDASKIYEDVDDVEKDGAMPVLNIRHDMTKRNTRGLRALLQTEKSLYKDGKLKGKNIVLPYSAFN
tara:strand:- start:893 stop:2005 length:1113 start_codon:yes stop_codon:yes gene_type:complete